MASEREKLRTAFFDAIDDCECDSSAHEVLIDTFNALVAANAELKARLALIQELEWLYSQERNVQISSFWDSGWTVKMGDRTNGFTATVYCDDLTDIADWLKREREAKEKGGK